MRLRVNQSLKIAAAFGLLITSACGAGDSGEVSANETGGVLVDGAQLSADEFISADPAMVYSISESQVATAIYDGLTEYDYSDHENPEIKPLVAESWEHNDDYDEWTFKIKDGLTFSNGDPVLPSSFKYAWERAGSAELASPYGYLIEFIAGGYDFYDQGLDHLDSIVADDEALTLTVSTESPYVEFPGLVSLPFFSPLPQSVVEGSEDPLAWGSTKMIGNGPFVLDAAPSETEVVLVPNDRWNGNVYGDKQVKLDRIEFLISTDYDSAFAAFEAGETDSAAIPTGRFKDATATYPNTVGTPFLSTEYYAFGWNDPQLGGEENTLLRQAISVAIDREEINEKVYGGSRIIPTGLVMPGVPGYVDGICEFCTYDPKLAEELLDDWKTEGGTLDGPITIDFNSDAGHEDVVALMAEDLEAVGIDVELNPGGEDYFFDVAEGGCHLCRAGWIADFPSYSNFTYDLFHSNTIGLNNLGELDSPELDEMLDSAQNEGDPAKRAMKFEEAERYILNDLTAAIVVNWTGGDKVYREGVEGYNPTPLGYIEWDRVSVSG